MANKIRIEEEDLKSIKEALWEDFEIEIVGNIYENPELLEPTK